MNPCQDFYQYACGGWEKRYLIPQYSSAVNNLDILDDRLAIVLKGLLEEPEKSTDIFTTKQSKRLYASCIDRTRAESQGIIRLRLVASVLNGLPIVTENYDISQIQLEDLYSYSQIYFDMLRPIPFRFTVEVDANNSNANILQVPK